MVNVLLLLRRIPHFYRVEHISCISNTYILQVLKLSLISISWSYLPQFVFILPTVLNINIMFSSPRRNGDHGRPWSPRYLMVDHGSSWSTVKYRGDDHGQVACDHGRPWSITVDHGQSRSTMVNHGRPWSIVDQITYDHGRPWSITVDHGQSQSTVVNHGRPWSITVDHGQSRSTMVNHGTPCSNCL